MSAIFSPALPDLARLCATASCRTAACPDQTEFFRSGSRSFLRQLGRFAVLLLALGAFEARSVAATVTFTTSTTINEGDTTYDGEDIIVSGATLTVNGSHSLNSVLLSREDQNRQTKLTAVTITEDTFRFLFVLESGVNLPVLFQKSTHLRFFWNFFAAVAQFRGKCT